MPKRYGYRGTVGKHDRKRYADSDYIYLGESTDGFYWLTYDCKVWIKPHNFLAKPKLNYWGTWDGFMYTLRAKNFPSMAPSQKCMELIEAYLALP